MNKNPMALLLSDIHVSSSNIPEFQKNWDEAISICKKRGIVDMIVGGDLWLSRSAQTLDVLMAVRQAIIKATKEGLILTIAEGNHCKVDQESLLGYSHIFSEYRNVYVIDECAAMEMGDDVVLYVMSYFPENGSFMERLEKAVLADLDKEKKNILYIHEGIRGGLAVPSDDELPASIFKPFSAVIVGHYHNRKKIEGTNIEYVGASRQHNFGEDEAKGYIVLYDDGSYDFVQNKANVRYKVVDVDFDNMQKGGDFRCDGYKVKLRVHCKAGQASVIDRQALSDIGCAKIEVITEETEAKQVASHALEHKFDKKGIKTEYTGFCADKGIADVEMGLKYLDKIN